MAKTPDTTARTLVVQIRLSRDERKTLEARAKSAKLTLSAFLRRLIDEA